MLTYVLVNFGPASRSFMTVRQGGGLQQALVHVGAHPGVGPQHHAAGQHQDEAEHGRHEADPPRARG